MASSSANGNPDPNTATVTQLLEQMAAQLRTEMRDIVQALRTRAPNNFVEEELGDDMGDLRRRRHQSMAMLTTGIAPPARTLVVVGASSTRPQLGFLQSGALGGGLFAQYSKNFILKGISGFGEESKLACSRDNVAVYRAVLPGDLDVVIKTQNCPRTMTSIEELRRLKHPNVLPLLGFCMAGKFP